MGIEDWGLGIGDSLHSFLSPLPFLLFYRKAVPCDLLTDCEGTFLPLSFALSSLSFLLDLRFCIYKKSCTFAISKEIIT